MWIELGAKPKWLPLNIGCHDLVRIGPIPVSAWPLTRIYAQPGCWTLVRHVGKHYAMPAHSDHHSDEFCTKGWTHRPQSEHSGLWTLLSSVHRAECLTSVQTHKGLFYCIVLLTFKQLTNCRYFFFPENKQNAQSLTAAIVTSVSANKARRLCHTYILATTQMTTTATSGSMLRPGTVCSSFLKHSSWRSRRDAVMTISRQETGSRLSRFVEFVLAHLPTCNCCCWKTVPSLWCYPKTKQKFSHA